MGFVWLDGGWGVLAWWLGCFWFGLLGLVGGEWFLGGGWLEEVFGVVGCWGWVVLLGEVFGEFVFFLACVRVGGCV